METRHIAQIFPNEKNRSIYDNPDQDELQELAEGIKRHGLKEPIVVTKDGKIISGHRRYYAAIKAGLSDVPIRYEHPQDDNHELELLVEYNRQRRKKPTEIYREAQVIRSILNKKEISGRTTDHIAKQVGLGSGRNLEKLEYVQENAPESIKAQLDRGEVSIHHAYQEAKKIQQAPKELQGQVAEKVEQGQPVNKAVAQVRAQENARLVTPHTRLDELPLDLDAIVLLPNWSYAELGMPDYGPRGWYSPSQPVITSEELGAWALGGLNFCDALKEDGFMFLFAPQYFVSQAHDVLISYGLMPVGMLAWVDVKYQSSQPSLIKDDVLYCVIGFNGDEMPGLNHSGWFSSEAKSGDLPEPFYALVEKIKPGGRYLQVFVESERQGWFTV